MKILFFLLSSLSISAQGIIKQINTEKSYKNVDIIFSKKNNLYINFRKDSHSNLGEVFVFNINDLDLKYTTDFSLGKNKNYLVGISNDGKSLLSESVTPVRIGRFESYTYYLRKEDGKDIELEIKTKWLPKSFKEKNSYVNENSFISIGYFSKKFKGVKNREYKIFKRNFNNLETTTYDIKLPNEFLENTASRDDFKVIDFSNESFKILEKSFGLDQNNNKIQNYLIAEYDYKGNLIKNLKLPVSIQDNEMNFRYSDNAEKAYDKLFTTSDKLTPTVLAKGMAIWDDKEEVYYTYSTITSDNRKEGGGFLISKFSKNGNKLWSKFHKVFNDLSGIDLEGRWSVTRMKPLKDKLFFTNINFNGKGYSADFFFDKDTGHILSSAFSNKFKRVSQLSDKINFKNFKDETTLSFVIGNVNISFPSSALLNEAFKNYLEGVKDETDDYNHTIEIKDNFLIVLEHNKTKGIWKLLRFDF